MRGGPWPGSVSCSADSREMKSERAWRVHLPIFTTLLDHPLPALAGLGVLVWVVSLREITTYVSGSLIFFSLVTWAPGATLLLAVAALTASKLFPLVCEFLFPEPFLWSTDLGPACMSRSLVIM